MDYDDAGNRTRIYNSVTYGIAGGGESGSAQERYFQYDSMHRQIYADQGDGSGSHSITYDKNGNRLSDTYFQIKGVVVD